MGRHELYSKDARVVLVGGADKHEALRVAVERSGFVANVEARWAASGKPKDQFSVVIKPNIMTASVREEDSPVYTDPALVEALFGILRQEGFSRFAVVESENVYNYSYRGRTVRKVAEMCGYTGTGYDIANLTEEAVPCDYAGLLGAHTAGRTWMEADYRVSFAKNKTHWQCYYTGCLKNVYGCLPEWDKMLFYHGRRRGKDIEFHDATVEVVERFPVHFGFLDAWVSGDGLTGHVRDASPNPTRMILASENILALDWVAGEKMGLDPMTNVVVRKAVARWGPVRVERDGDMTPWVRWRNLRPIVLWVMDIVEEWYGVSRFFSRLAAAYQDPRFPPVNRLQWFFGLAHVVVRALERLAVTSTLEQQAPRRREMTGGLEGQRPGGV